MLIEPTCENWTDRKGRPAGGVAFGPGFAISWQNGPLGKGNDRKEPNGAFVESVIAAALQRIEHYQESGFACDENRDAIHNLTEALHCLNERTYRRENAGTEGTHEGN